MIILEPGHIYQLRQLDLGSLHHPPVVLTFVNREPGTEHPGTQTQEVIRALIDRTQHCDHCLRWEGNDLIIYHLRMALVLHEMRALERKTVKGIIHPEKVKTGPDGHFALRVASDEAPLVSNGCSQCGCICGQCRCENATGTQVHTQECQDNISMQSQIRRE